MPEQRRVSLVLGDYPHVAGIAGGSIPVDGAAFERVVVPSLQDAFKRMCREVCFDVCEMSITGYLLARRYGLPFTALPIFTVRGFPQSHAGLVVRRGAGITSPRDLEGRRVGARAYTGTASLWVRGVLAGEYGVDVDAITWVSAEDEHVPQYQHDAPTNVSYELGGDLDAMLAGGDLSGAIGPRPAGEFVPLFEDPRREAAGFYQRTGILQINHTIVVRDAVLAAQPGLARSLHAAFVEAKRRWLKDSSPGLADELNLPAGDPFPYGLEANDRSIAALLRYAYQQKLTTHLMTPEEAFPLAVA